MSGPRLYLIAGEPSGDRLGAGLMRALAEEAPGARFEGVGGLEMQAAGLMSLFDAGDLAVMGIAEVVPRLRLILRRLRETSADVLARAPDALITIDSPAFSLRVAERVRKARPDLPVIHYVAPSVWAWRPGRARHMARFVDHVLALLPFEPPYMEAAGMSCDFVGHPVATRPVPAPEAVAAYRAEIGAGPETPLLLIAPGSRRGEVSRLMPVFLETAQRLMTTHPALRLVVPLAETVADEVTSALAGLRPAPVLLPPDLAAERRMQAFAAADAALVASGTITLEMAAAGTPMVAAYRAHWMTAAMLRRLVRVDTGNLVNLVDGGRPVPELLQEALTPGAAAEALAPLLAAGPARAAQMSAFDRVMTALGRGGLSPSIRAARSVMGMLEREGRVAGPGPSLNPDPGTES